MIISEDMTIERKLTILADAAKYDVACTSSGVERKGRSGMTGNSSACGICHTFAADGRCISLLKILYTNECIYDCKYCANRSSNDTVRASFTPEELCELTIGFYRRNYIEGLFLSSGILHSPNETMEQICKALRMLREQYMFNGYIHCKAIPGADPSLIEMCGWYADRMSTNLELPTAESLRQLAPHKSRKNILLPIRQIQDGIAESHALIGMSGGNKGAYWYTQQHLEGDYSEFTGGVKQVMKDRERLAARINQRMNSGQRRLEQPEQEIELSNGSVSTIQLPEPAYAERLRFMNEMTGKRGFVPAGQSSQMIVGATPESDLQIISVSEALYERFDLKRVFYSAFVRLNDDSALPVLPGGPPLLREHRLYQADWLLRFYGFRSAELLSEQRPNFNIYLDPKCNWALGHLEQFPIEVNTADYFTLLRVPGIGPKSARRIVAARKSSALDFDDLKKIGVVLKRAVYFIMCRGKMIYRKRMDENTILSRLIGEEAGTCRQIIDSGMTYRQLSLFDTMSDPNLNGQRKIGIG